MIVGLQKTWFRIKGGHPGRRFHDFYRHRQMERGYRFTFGKIVAIVLGLAIVAVGLALIPLPGPGAVIAVFGLALLGSEFEPVARALDWMETKTNPTYRFLKQRWERVPGATRVGLELLSGIIGLFALYFGYMFFFRK
jgi:uncharacterized protein (TIGR02611 family)